MPLVDAQGRLFGRLNLLDALLGLLLLGLIPLAFAAYVLFRTPAPRLTAVEPATLVKGPNLRVTVRGENLRPYMRVSFGTVQGNTFIFRSTSEALVDLNEMPPGAYDVVLYDEAQERARLPRAFTLLPIPLPESQVIVIGTLGNLTAERAAAVKAGMVIPGVGEIVQAGTPLPEATRVYAGPVLEIPVDKAVRLPVALRVGCAVRAPQGVPQCAIGDAPLQPIAMIVLNTPIGMLPFQVDQIRGVQRLEPVQITAQFVARREVLGQIKKGDVDHGQYVNALAAGATVSGMGQPVDVGGDAARLDVTLTALAQRGTSSWTYAAAPLRAGAAIVFRTPRYELQGSVVRIDPPWSSAAETNGSKGSTY